MSGIPIVSLCLGLLLLVLVGAKDTHPVHVHLAYGSLDNQMQVTFASDDACHTASVLYGEDSSLSNNVTAIRTRFENGNTLGHQYVYNALLEDLVPSTSYSYVCTCDGDKSKNFQFTSKDPENNWAPKLLVFGDMGRVITPQALPGLISEVKSGWPDAAIHIGDFAYNLDTLEGKFGDIFMDQIEDIAAYIPYMVAVGNHEFGYNYSHYINRFNMPNTDDNMWFSWDLANVHFIAYSTEVYFYETQYPAFTAKAQYEWLQQDLIQANANRAERPWIIAYGHRPFYCSNNDGDDCTQNVSIVRAHLEDLFYKFGVDIILEAHEHSYERLWPVYNAQVTQNDYDNPQAPVHIITGVAGCNENFGHCINDIPGPRGPWSAFRASGRSVYGYGKLQIFNDTHIFWEEIEVESNTTLDSIWITQTSHGPFQ